MAVAEPPTAAAARSLEQLAERFDRSSLEPVKDGSRARLHVAGKGAWDAVVDRNKPASTLLMSSRTRMPSSPPTPPRGAA